MRRIFVPRAHATLDDAACLPLPRGGYQAVAVSYQSAVEVPAHGRRIEIRGVVQGVGLRPWVYRLAHEEGVTGQVHNDAAGVTIEAFGGQTALENFLRRLQDSPPPAARISALRWQSIPPRGAADFAVADSQPLQARHISIPPDLPTCPRCLADISDPNNRRYRYAFTNCTDCGPRFTITRDVPYDRPATTMAAFTMCADCQREYDTVADRRFHAQPNACPLCGPRLRVLSPQGDDLCSADPIRDVAAALAAGLVAAIKGIGGFHLACDATSAPSVRRLRALKMRDEKPFAVMVRDLAGAELLAHLTDAEKALLASAERPIVLARRRRACALCVEVAPRNLLVGLLLPYSPLHHLLLQALDRPLVMTSGNLCEEPIAYRDGEALQRLGARADLFLVHDREIEARCDDSVARIIAGTPVVLRRARGHVPRPVAVARRFARPVLACGAQLKNTFCIGVGHAAYLGPHIGDLENLETLRAFEDAVARMERFLRLEPEVIAHDLHPDYPSTRYALGRSAALTVGVQHHHAHVASAMAENGLAGPVIGVAYDGTGYGPDGAAWGGEVLLADYAGFERLATFRPIPLAGGETAIRQVWRIALALLDDAFGGAPPLEALRLFRAVPAAHAAVVRRMIARRFNAPLAHGVGRYFDAFGALVLNRPRSRYEGQVALEWNLIADPAETGQYAFAVCQDAVPWSVDLRPVVRAVVSDLTAGRSPSTISARFHNTLVAATVQVVRAAARRCGRLPVVLTGGCFQNARLTEGVLEGLAGRFTVHRHRRIPPGDGGIALGQALIADAVARRGA
jgi:hydrogenase maturation protein HypF